ncbi:MAG: AraC family transcriptional regulator [Clostridia bacterium]|nr:AraC family transcriptional regulator [Clostridia bacterium]
MKQPGVDNEGLIVERDYNDTLSKTWNSVAMLYSLEDNPNEKLYMCHFGYHRCCPGYVFGPRVRDLYLIHYVCDGKGTLEKSGRKYAIGKGESFIINPSEVTTYQADTDDPWTYCFFAFDGEMAPLLASSAGFGEKDVLTINNDDVRDIIFSSLKTVEEQNNKYTFGLAILTRLINIYAQKNTRTPGNAKKNYATAAKEYIDYYFSEKISINSIAESLHIARNYLYSLFKKQYGISPEEYLTNKRYELACMLLAESDNSCEEIAGLCGFATYSAFHRIFIRKSGMSASRYRSVYRGKE